MDENFLKYTNSSIDSLLYGIEHSSHKLNTIDERNLDDKLRAKQWAYYIEALKRSIDCLYEICYSEQSIIGCKEALMYLTNSVRDFEALIETINVEVSWKDSTKPQSVAWELRKTTSPIGKSVVDIPQEKEAQFLIDLLKFSPVMQGTVVAAINSKLNSHSNHVYKESGDPGNVKKLKASTVNSGWRLAIMRNGERECGDFSVSTSNVKNWLTHKERKSRTSSIHTRNLHERSAARVNGTCNQVRKSNRIGCDSLRNGKDLMFPKCAMDLPQTKSSMAKIAHSRELLWKKHQPLLMEKFQRKRRRTANCSSRRTVSVPSLSANYLVDSVATQCCVKDCKCKEASVVHDCCQLQDVVDIEKCALASPSIQSEPTVNISILVNHMNADDEWRAITEEENSLVLEEQSLKREIDEEESLSIDAELASQVAAEAEELEALEIVENGEIPGSSLEERELEIASVRSAVDSWKIRWSEVLERESSRYREPGKFVQMHEKLSSPSRKRRPEGSCKKHEERQQRAEEFRQKLLHEKAARLRDLSAKVEEVRHQRLLLLERKREHMQKRLVKAEVNRQRTIDEIIKKARDDDVKVMEIKFINALEADNWRHDLIARSRIWEHRVQTVAEERARKGAERAAKMEATDEQERAVEIPKESVLIIGTCEEQLEMQMQQPELKSVFGNDMEMEKVDDTERNSEKKAIDVVESKKLLEKIKQKQVVSERRRQDVLSSVRNRASNSKSSSLIVAIPNVTGFYPKLSGQTATSLAFSNLNRLNCDLDVTAHIISEQHLAKRGIQVDKITEDVFRVEIEECLSACDGEFGSVSVMEEFSSDIDMKSLKECRSRLQNKISVKFVLLQECCIHSDHFQDASTTLFLILEPLLRDFPQPFTLKVQGVRISHQPSKSFQFFGGIMCQARDLSFKVDRNVRALARIIREILPDSVIQNCCNGIPHGVDARKIEQFNTQLFEKHISGMIKSYRSESEGRRSVLIKTISNTGLIDLLLATLSCLPSSNGSPSYLTSRSYCKALSFLSDLMADVHILVSIFYSNRVLVLVDTVCNKLKLVLEHAKESNDSNHSPDMCIRRLIECHSLLSLFARLVEMFFYHADLIKTELVCEERINQLDRMKTALMLLVTNGFSTAFAEFIEKVGLDPCWPWYLKLDDQRFVLTYSAFLQVFLSFAEASLGTMNEAEPISEKVCFSLPEGSVFPITSSVELAFRSLVNRIHSFIIAHPENNLSLIDRENYDTDPSEDGHHSMQTLVSLLDRLWCIIVKHNPAEAKVFSDTSLLLRMLQIWTHFIAQHGKDLHSLAGSATKDRVKRKISDALHLSICATGYFACVNAQTKFMCVLGWQQSLLMRLCTLPFGYFSNRHLSSVLIPTLMAICFRNEVAVDSIEPVLSTKVFENFLRDADFTSIPENKRFPKELWQEAAVYFGQL